MTTHLRRILNDALALTADERAELAVELVASVDGTPDADAATAWASEIERRLERTLDGSAESTDWPTLRDRIDRRLRS